MAIYPKAEQIQRLLAGPADGPVVMVNLLRFKERADAPHEKLTGQQAYALYAEKMRPFVESKGGRFVWMGRVDSVVIEDGEQGYDAIALVEYPSRKAFVQIASDPHVAEIGKPRAAGLESQWLIACTGAGGLP